MNLRRAFNFLTFNLFCAKEKEALEEKHFLKNNNQKKIEVIISFQCTKTMIIYSESEEKAHRDAYRKLMDSVDTFSDTEFESTLPVEINSKNFHSIQNI